MTDVQDIIYVKTGAFNSANNQLIAYDIEKMNRGFTAEENELCPGRSRPLGQQRFLVGHSGETGRISAMPASLWNAGWRTIVSIRARERISSRI